MARIRSIHPGLFTDERFVELSSDAQIFYIGLLTEADDQGIFEWKPSTLRMRLRPTKDGAVDGLLSELAAHDFIKSYEIGGRKLGAIRNFRKYQHPKFPNSTHPITEDIRIYVGLTQPITVIDPHHEPPIPRNAEKSFQMERRGEELKEREQGPPDADASQTAPRSGLDEARKIFDAWNEIVVPVGLPRVRKLTKPRRRAIALRLRDAGGVDELIGVFRRVSASKFLCGHANGNGHQAWCADFDFVLTESKFIKILEGKYDDRTDAGGLSEPAKPRTPPPVYPEFGDQELVR